MSCDGACVSMHATIRIGNISYILCCTSIQCAQVQREKPSSGSHFFNQQQRVCTFFAAISKPDHARDDRTYSTVGSCNGQSHACYIIPLRSSKAWKLYTTYHGICPLPVAGLYTGPAIHVFTVLYVCVVFPAMHVIINIILYN